MVVNQPKAERRFPRFSVRALLVFVMLLRVPLARLGLQIERARRQREVAVLSLRSSDTKTSRRDRDE